MLSFLALVPSHMLAITPHPQPGAASQHGLSSTFVSEGSQLYRIGSSAPQAQQQGLLSDGDDVENDETSEDGAEEPLNEPLTKRGQTAARIIAQQIPLPAGLTATDIMTNHKDRLQYNNMLKVALTYSNQKIAAECKANQSLKQPNGVVKRINTALT